MSPATKTQIDPKVEDGAVLLAEEVLSASEARLECAKALEDAWRPYQDTQERIDAAIKRQEDIAEELRAVPGETTRKKLSAERTALTGELVHAAADIEAVAEPFASALGQWANITAQHATSEYKRVDREIRPLKVERMKVQERLDEARAALMERENENAKRDGRWPPNWSNPCTIENEQGESELEPGAADLAAAIETVRQEHRDISDRIAALVEEGERYEAVLNGATGAVAKFGGRSYNGNLFDVSGQRDWVRRTRARASRKTTGITGLSDILKPTAF